MAGPGHAVNVFKDKSLSLDERAGRSTGRSLALQARGYGFESRPVHKRVHLTNGLVLQEFIHFFLTVTITEDDISEISGQ